MANIKAEELCLVRGVTGSEGDVKSLETVREIISALGKGRDCPVELGDLLIGLRQMLSPDFDAAASAGLGFSSCWPL